MNKEDELARQLERELEAASPEQATPPYNLPPEVRQRLETAGQMAQVDFSQGSALRPALRARLAVKARRTLPGAYYRAQLARRLQPVLAGIGIVALLLLLGFGVSLAVNRLHAVPAVSPQETSTATATHELAKPTATLTPPATPAPTATASAASDEKHLVLESGLQVEEFALTGAPQVEPLTLNLRSGGQPEVFFLPSNRLSPPASEIDAGGRRIIKASLGAEQLSAVLFETSRTTNADGSVFLQEAVQVVRGGQVVYTTQPADASPIDPLRGLWTYGDHWVLEYARVTNTIKDNTIESYVTGQIIQDGELLNDSLGYQEAFGFQTFAGNPFYFFKRDGQIGVNYAGQETMLGYDDVPHYGCCSAAELNPRQYVTGVTFTAQRNGTYYYVVIGIAPDTSGTLQSQETLFQFLTDLAGGQDDPALYDAAAQLYGGSWAEMEAAYPEANGDHFTLFQKACAPGGLYNCLKVLQVSPPEKLAEGRFRLWVQFGQADGSVWSSSNNGQSWYDFELVRGPGGQWKVMDPPPTGLGFRYIVAHLSATETAGLDDNGILRALWEDYMQRSQFTLLDAHNRIIEYEILDVKADAGSGLQQKMDIMGSVTFSVRPVQMEYSDWVAGNGEVDGEWVRSKFLFIGAIKDGSAVHLKIIGTGP